MTENLLERLTPREREALEAYFVHAHRGAAAAALKISENTLKAHLASARRKLAMPDHRIVRLMFPELQGPHPKWASPYRVIDENNNEWPVSPVDTHSAPTATSGPLFDSMHFGKQAPAKWDYRRNDLTLLPRIVLVAIAMMAVVITLVLAFSFNDGLQRWSNTIATPTRH